MSERERLERLYSEMREMRDRKPIRPPGSALRAKETAESAALLVACPYCLAPRNRKCGPRYAGEVLAGWGHPSRLKLAGSLANAAAEETVADLRGGRHGA